MDVAQGTVATNNDDIICGRALSPRLSALHIVRQTRHFQHADVHPADVELIPLKRELRGRLDPMVVVVELLAADQNTPRKDIARRILFLGDAMKARETAVTPCVSDAVNDAGGKYRDPEHLDHTDRETDPAE